MVNDVQGVMFVLNPGIKLVEFGTTVADQGYYGPHRGTGRLAWPQTGKKAEMNETELSQLPAAAACIMMCQRSLE